MKNSEPSNIRDPLHPVLQRWTVTHPLPPWFEARVWQRIKAAHARPVPAYARIIQWIETALARPVLAAAYVCVLLLLGLTLGHWQARIETSRAENSWRTLYVQAVDPYQTPRP
ncbi:MAG: hypothetical protein ACYDH9_08380 [Limisphaerales bacterium]